MSIGILFQFFSKSLEISDIKLLNSLLLLDNCFDFSNQFGYFAVSSPNSLKILEKFPSQTPTMELCKLEDVSYNSAIILPAFFWRNSQADSKFLILSTNIVIKPLHNAGLYKIFEKSASTHQAVIWSI